MDITSTGLCEELCQGKIIPASCVASDPTVENAKRDPSDSVTNVHRNLQEAMDAYFQETMRDESQTSTRRQYSDADIQEISSLLRFLDRLAWSRIPRLYIVLRRIAQLSLLDIFIAQGVTDMWVPFSATSLPRVLPQPSNWILSRCSEWCLLRPWI
jgi:hypothetical protein